MKIRIKGDVIDDIGAHRGYQITYRCPSDGTVTIYFDYLVHKTDEDCNASMTVQYGGQHGDITFKDQDARFDNKNFRWNPTMNVLKDQAIVYYIGIQLHNAEASKPMEFVLDFDDGK